MKTNKYAFPYPVLTNDQGNGADYADAGFQCTLDFSEEVDEDGNLKIEYCFELSNTEIQQLIDEGYAAFSLNIYCVETLFRTSEILQSEGVYKVPASSLFGKVEFTPTIVVRSPVDNFSSEDFSPEFSGNFTLREGDIIAVDDTVPKFIEFNNLSFNSLVKTRLKEELGRYEYRIEPSPSFIYVDMGEEMWRVWNEIRGSRDDKAILMMSVFKDLLFLAISDLMDSEEEGGQQWARSLASKLAEMDIELPKEPDFNLINLMAQKLVCEKGITVLCNRVGKS